MHKPALEKKLFRGRVAGIITLFNHASLTRDPFGTEALCIVLKSREIQIDSIYLLMLVTTVLQSREIQIDSIYLFMLVTTVFSRSCTGTTGFSCSTR